MTKRIGWGLAVAAAVITVCPIGNAQTNLTTWTFTPVDFPGLREPMFGA